MSASGARTSAPGAQGRRAGGRRHARARPARRRRPKRTREGQSEYGVGEGDGGSLEFAREPRPPCLNKPLTKKTATRTRKAAEVEAAQSNVDRLKALKAFANIVAPFDGVVTARNVDVGSLVKADSNDSGALFTVADIHQMRIYVPVPQSYAAAMKDGMKATLELPEYPDRTFNATIVTTSHAIDKKSRTLLVELLADNKDGVLAPGAFARVHFHSRRIRTRSGFPRTRCMFRDNAAQVAILGLDNRIVLKKVRIARDLGSEVEIAGGLSHDARIVANPPDSIDDGRGGPGHASRRGEDPNGARTASGTRPADRPKSTEEIAQTGRDHDE